MTSSLLIRPAVAADAAALDRLAQLDSRALPAGPHLVAVADGRLVAATGPGGDAVADPFLPTADAVALLRERTRQLAAPRGRRAPRGRLAIA